MSGSDHAETALSLGAVGYAVKPVKREQLVEVLEKLELKLSQGVHRILIVEDDPVQRDAVAKLLSSGDVETVTASTAAECLELLKQHTFDCMVLDLSLPDASGYSLLETLSRESAYAFPPVIVYTGRDLSADDEQRLRRYSKSIIIKGAKSPGPGCNSCDVGALKSTYRQSPGRGAVPAQTAFSHPSHRQSQSDAMCLASRGH